MAQEEEEIKIPIEIFNNCEIELTEVYGNENLGITFTGKTTINLESIFRTQEIEVKAGRKMKTGTRIWFDLECFIDVLEPYKDVEMTRRIWVALIIHSKKKAED